MQALKGAVSNEAGKLLGDSAKKALDAASPITSPKEADKKGAEEAARKEAGDLLKGLFVGRGSLGEGETSSGRELATAKAITALPRTGMGAHTAGGRGEGGRDDRASTVPGGQSFFDGQPKGRAPGRPQSKRILQCAPNRGPVPGNPLWKNAPRSVD